MTMHDGNITTFFKVRFDVCTELTDANLIKEIEQIGSISWLAREIESLGGWTLRANDGVTRRANSVLPLDEPNCDIQEAIEYVIRFYAARNLIPRFQMTEISRPHNLEELLVDSGWKYGLEVEIEIANVDTVLDTETTVTTKLIDHPSQDWLNAYEVGSGHTDKDSSIRPKLMTRSTMKKVFALSIIDNRIASVGIGILCGQWIGLYSITTLPEFRRMNAGIAVSQAIVSWGKEHHATQAYLQVETDNHPAKRLYSRLGFKHCYTYWYRYYHQEKD